MKKIRFDRIGRIGEITKSKNIFENKEKIILRDFLAMERTSLANERTLFSYIRTALYLVLAGIAFLKIKYFSEIEFLSYGIFIFSFLLAFFGVIRFLRLKNKLKEYYDSMPHHE
jgi:putative membrane protein